MRSRLFLLLATIFSFLTSFPQVPSELLGSWRGEVIEPGRSDWYQVIITINEGRVGEPVATVYYPDYACGGDLKLINTKPGPGLVMREVLTDGRLRCINMGWVNVELVEGTTDQIHFTWSHDQWMHRAIGYLRKLEL